MKEEKSLRISKIKSKYCKKQLPSDIKPYYKTTVIKSLV